MTVIDRHSVCSSTALAMALFACLLTACSSILPEKEAPSNFYSLDYLPADAAARRATAHGAGANAGRVASIIVTPPRAAPGFDRPLMVYLREPHHIEYFAQNQWVEAPPRMLAPLITAALDRSGAFRAVLQAPSAAAGDVRLNTEILRLQQEFFGKPSKLRFSLRARLVDDATRKVIASREFEALVDAPGDNPYAGVQAANRAVNQVLEELTAFCVEQARDLTAMAAK
jgi:cholesterol transport system auxiliary component